MAFGTILASLFWNLVNTGSGAYCSALRDNLKNTLLWKYVGSQQSFGIISSYFLLYPGMNALARAGAGAVAFPLMVGSCIVCFSIYSMWILREHSQWQFPALAICLLGIAGICIPA